MGEPAKLVGRNMEALAMLGLQQWIKPDQGALAHIKVWWRSILFFSYEDKPCHRLPADFLWLLFPVVYKWFVVFAKTVAKKKGWYETLLELV